MPGPASPPAPIRRIVPASSWHWTWRRARSVGMSGLDPSSILDTVLRLLPALPALIAPLLAEWSKTVARKLKRTLPRPVRRPLAAVIGMVLAGLASALTGHDVMTTAVTGGLVGTAGSVGYGTAKRHETRKRGVTHRR